jgi:hypothetical protein
MSAEVSAHDDEEALTKEVYACFGLAYYMTECVHRGLVQSIALLPLDKLSATHPRIEERFGAYEKLTFGQLMPHAKEVLPSALHESLDWALARRNFLAHGFWYERIHQMSSVDGKQHLVEELEETATSLRSLNRAIDDLVLAHQRHLGMTQDAWEAALQESKVAPPEPVPRRKIPKLGERIEFLKAWVVKIGPSANLLLEDAHGERWQLCDAGLGWSFLDRSEGTWTELTKLRLPGSIVARPRDAKPWDYTLQASTGMKITVEPGGLEGGFRWGVRPA